MMEVKLKTDLSEPCLICGKLTEKLHLQVQICYGCAAFYRRSVNSGKAYKCRNGKGKCNLITSTKTGLCRLCRFNRCLELHLKVNKLCQKFNSLEITYEPDNSNPWNIYDLFHQIHGLLNKNSNSLMPISSTTTNSFTYFSETLFKFIEASMPKQEWIPFSMTPETTLKSAYFFNNFAKNSAKLLLSCSAFKKLPINEKLLVHDRFWQMFLLLRDYFVSYEHCGKDPSDFKCLIDNFQFIDAATVGALMAVDMKNEGYRVFLIPYGQKHANLCEEFKIVKPTFIEFSYICVIALWSFHMLFASAPKINNYISLVNVIFSCLPQLSQSTQNLGDSMIEDASANLHEYYLNELRMTNYASRQSKLFKIALMVEDIVRSKIEMLKAWTLFNFGKHSFSFPKFETDYYSYKN